MSDLTYSKEVVTKVYEHYNEQTDTTTTYKRRAFRIELGGADWLFAQRKIYTQNDAELEMASSLHNALLGLIASEQEARRNAKAHRNAGVRVVIPNGTNTVTTTQTETKKVTKTTSNKGMAKVSSALDSLLAGGITPEQLIALLMGGKK